MDTILQTFLSLQFLFFCLGIAAITFVLRKIVDYILTLKGLQNNKLWNELILPIMPVILGVLCASVAKRYPFPDIFGVSVSAKMNFGLVAGLFSGLVYKIIKGLLSQKLPANIAKVLTNVNLSESKEDPLIEGHSEENLGEK